MTSISHPPSGYAATIGAPTDLTELVELISAAQVAYEGVAVASESFWRAMIADPEVDPASDYLQLRSMDTGALAGIARYRNTPPHVESSTQGYVHPDHEGRGLGTHILGWGLDRSGALVDKAPENARITTTCYAAASNTGAARLFEDNGYTADRYFLEMERVLDEPVTVEPMAEGLVLRTMRGVEDIEVIVDPVMEAFRDHYGHTETTREAEVAQWHLWREVDEWDDDLVWIVEDSGKAIAANVCVTSQGARVDTGYVAVLGVLREWRGRGIARSLLTTSFAEFRRRGSRAVSLHVDGESLTGAKRLYEGVGMHETQRSIDHIHEIRAGEDLVVR